MQAPVYNLCGEYQDCYIQYCVYGLIDEYPEGRQFLPAMSEAECLGAHDPELEAPVSPTPLRGGYGGGSGGVTGSGLVDFP